MKITRAKSTLHRVRPATQWEDSTHRVTGLEFIVTEIETDDGTTGTGMSYTVGVGGSAILALITDYCLPVVLGQDPRQFARLHTLLASHLHRTGSGGVNTLAIAAIDSAIWDLLARGAGQPLHRYLGGSRDCIHAYGSGIDLFMNIPALRDHLGRYLSAGYTAVKIKVGRPTLREDVERVRLARETIGDDCELLLDANQCWRLDEAVERVRAFEPFRPRWIEEPLVPEDVSGHARLRQAAAVPVAIGESLYSAEQFLAYLRADAVDILQPDIARVGGITPWLRIAALAQAWNRPVAPHFLSELSVQLLCAVPNGLILENVTGGSLAELGLAHSPVTIKDGFAIPSLSPGHGIEFDRDALAASLVRPGQLAATDTSSSFAVIQR